MLECFNMLESSFRDPCGFVFRDAQSGEVYRQVNQRYRDDYESLMHSGLYGKLAESRLLIPHEKVQLNAPLAETAFCVIRPEQIPFVSYPYEWSFSQLKDAALLTLHIQEQALEHGMSLKDASAYNIQFNHSRPVFIDTLSFERYTEGKPWIAYGQFCKHFLAPLALMAYTDVRLSQLLRIYIDGVPLDLASKLLPFKTKLNLGLFSHLHLHAQFQNRYADDAASGESRSTQKLSVSKRSLLGIIDALRSTIQRLNWKLPRTEWGDYYNETNYTQESFEGKKRLVKSFVESTSSKMVWDLGANQGVFSKIAQECGAQVIAFDIDPVAVERNYLSRSKGRESTPLPLLLDLTNPSPGLGWSGRERDSFLNRGPVDLTLALALIHHIALSNNVPLLKTAEFFSQCSEHLIIEFVPKSDSQVKRLLATREDIFPDYHLDGFREAYSQYFTLLKEEPVPGSERTLFLMKKKKP